MLRVFSLLEQNGERWLLLIFYSMIVATISCEVIRRFVLSYSSIWGEEIARYSFIYLVWIGAAVGIKDRSHIRIDVLLNLFSPRGRAIAMIFGDLATLTLAVIALYWSMEPVLTSIKFESVTDGLRVSKAWFLAAVPFGFLLITLRLLQSMKRDIKTVISGGEMRADGKMFD